MYVFLLLSACASYCTSIYLNSMCCCYSHFVNGTFTVTHCKFPSNQVRSLSAQSSIPFPVRIFFFSLIRNTRRTHSIWKDAPIHICLRASLINFSIQKLFQVSCSNKCWTGGQHCWACERASGGWWKMRFPLSLPRLGRCNTHSLRIVPLLLEMYVYFVCLLLFFHAIAVTIFTMAFIYPVEQADLFAR